MPASDERPALSLRKKLLFAILPSLVLVLAAEAVLRLTGAADRCPGYANNILWVCDPVLHFRSNPGQVIHGRRLNRLGFRSREFTSKPPGTFRVLALGDSCTFGVISPGQTNALGYVREPYPQRLERLAAEEFGPGAVEVLNAAVPGYNTYQGIMLLRTTLRGLSPDLITARFGWNDLFMSAGAAAGKAFREPATAAGRAAQDLLLHTAIYRFSQRLGMALGPALRRRASVPPSRPAAWRPNIPLEQYAHNLRRIADLGRAQGVEVWFLTTPHAFLLDEYRGRSDRFGPASSAGLLLAFNGIPSFERLIEIHAAYNEATRRVGAEIGVPVIDMAAAYSQHAGEHLFAPGDVLHPTQQGHDLEARTLLEELRKRMRGT